MDPLTPFSLAGTAVQFVNFSVKFLKTGHELYNSPRGSLAANEEIERVVLHISHLITKLQRPLMPDKLLRNLTMEEQTLADICSECATLAEDILTRLDGLKVKIEKGGIKRVLQKVLRQTWTEKELESLVERLERFKGSLEMYILVALK